MFVFVNVAGANEVEQRSSDVDPLPRPLPEVRTRSVNSGTSDTNAEDTIYVNDDMEIEDDLMDFGGMEELVASDLFGFRSVRSEAASGHTPGITQSGPQTTSSGNNSVSFTLLFPRNACHFDNQLLFLLLLLLRLY